MIPFLCLAFNMSSSSPSCSLSSSFFVLLTNSGCGILYGPTLQSTDPVFIIHRMIRWKKVLQPGLNKGHWTAEEDEVICREVAAAEVMGRVSV